ncbi:MAG: RluA family pseudouridine synthase [Thiohalobacteraceae bacterium]
MAARVTGLARATPRLLRNETPIVATPESGDKARPDQSAARIELTRTVTADDSRSLIDFLHLHTNLSKQQLKDAALKGAVLLRRAGSARRVRRAKTDLRPGDRVELHYDRDLLKLRPPVARCVADRGGYSLWYKPAGLLAQGTAFGDHCALTRQVEQAGEPVRPVWLVHRLDREASGLMLLAHSRPIAANLSRQFQAGSVRKMYRVQLRGDIASALGGDGEITQPLDGKPAVTAYHVEHRDPDRQRSTLVVQIHTGRLHQIRRHFAGIGYPLIGDSRYGTDNKDPDGLRLVAVALTFECPLQQALVEFRLAPEEVGF